MVDLLRTKVMIALFLSGLIIHSAEENKIYNVQLLLNYKNAHILGFELNTFFFLSKLGDTLTFFLFVFLIIYIRKHIQYIQTPFYTTFWGP